MDLTGSHLRIHIALAVASAAVVLLAGCGDTGQPVSDDEFLESVRGSGPEATAARILPPSSARPAIELETQHYQVGTIANNKITTGGVRIFNRGDAPLEILDVSTSCPCTQGIRPKAPIAPGESVVMDVTVDPFKIAGFEATRYLTIRTNDPLQPTITLPVTAYVDPEIKYEADDLVLTSVPKGTTPEVNVRVSQLIDQPLEISAVEVRPPDSIIEAEYTLLPEDDWETPGKREYLVTARIKRDAPAGQHTARVQVDLNYERIRNFGFPVRATIVAPYQFEPMTLTRRGAIAGEALEGAFTLSSEVPIEITSIQSESGSVRAEYRAGPQPNSYLIDVYPPEAPERRLVRDVLHVAVRVGDKDYTEPLRVTLQMNI